MSRQQWSTKLGAVGVRVDGIDELAQALSIVLTTPQGAVPGRPAFGSKLHELIDLPLTEVRVRAPQEVRRAVEANDPRITVLEVNVVASESADGQPVCQVYWRPTASPDAAALMAEVPVG